MRKHVEAFLKSASEALELHEPAYEFGYSPGSDWSPGHALSGCPSETGAEPSDPSLRTDVERLEDLAKLPFPDGAARTVIVIDALEHVFKPHRAADEIIRVLAPGGILLLCSAANAQGPEPASRYWQLTPQAIQGLLSRLEATLIGWQGGDRLPHTLFAIGCKPPVASAFGARMHRFLDRFQKHLDQGGARPGWRERLARWFFGWLEDEATRRARRDFHQAHFVLHLPVKPQLKHELLASCLPEEDTGTRFDMSR